MQASLCFLLVLLTVASAIRWPSRHAPVPLPPPSPFLPKLPDDVTRLVLRSLPDKDLGNVRLVDGAANFLVRDDTALPYWQSFLRYELARLTRTAADKLRYLYQMAHYAKHASKPFVIEVDESLTNEVLAEMDALFLQKGLTFGLKGNTTRLALRPLQSLTLLDLSYLQLTSLDGLSFPLALEELDLEENALQEVDTLATLPRLKALNLAYNDISVLSGMRFATSLRVLNLSANLISSLVNVTWPPFLSVLRLGQNNIDTLRGVSFGNHLQELYLQNNEIAFHVNEMVHLPPMLRVLDVSHNPLHSLSPFLFPDSLVKVVAWSIFLSYLEGTRFPAGLEELDMRNNLLESTSALAACKSLRVLNVSHNHLKTMDALDGLSLLEKMDLSHNYMAIAQLNFSSTLRELDVSYNAIVAESIAFPPHLRDLRAESCSIQAVANIGALTRLEELSFAVNHLQALPGLDKLAHLRVLNLSRNRLVSVAAVSHMLRLERLDASFNDIQGIKNVNFSATLKEVNLSGNLIWSLRGVDFGDALEHLLLSQTFILSLDGFRIPNRLKTFDLSRTLLMKLGTSTLPVDVKLNIIETPLTEQDVH